MNWLGRNRASAGHLSGDGSLKDAPVPPGIPAHRGGHVSADVTIEDLQMPSTMPTKPAGGHRCDQCGCSGGEQR